MGYEFPSIALAAVEGHLKPDLASLEAFAEACRRVATVEVQKQLDELERLANPSRLIGGREMSAQDAIDHLRHRLVELTAG